MNRRYRELLNTLAAAPTRNEELPEALRAELVWAEWSGQVRYDGVTRVYRVTRVVADQLKAGKVFRRPTPRRRDLSDRWLS